MSSVGVIGTGGSLSERCKERSWAEGGIPVMVSSLDFSATEQGLV